MPRPDRDDILMLAIETSCDETAAALVRGTGEVVAQTLKSQIDAHRPYGGVVPEIAARQHIQILDGLISDLFQGTGLALKDVTAVSATTGPGLIGGLMVGAMTGKAIAAALSKPFIGVNHLEGHALTVRLTDGVAYPYLLLLVSGGHCQILDVAGLGRYHRLGTTIDDAAGEAFDKTAKLLNLPYPGGPSVERAAKSGNPDRFAFPRPLRDKAGFDFSFSGLKTAVRREAEKCVERSGHLSDSDVADLCAGFQSAITDCLRDRMDRAATWFRDRHRAALKDGPTAHLVVAGGVAANQTIRGALQEVAAGHDMIFTAPPLALCTDNAVMIAWAAIEHFLADPERNDRDQPARPRWPLDPEAEARIGGGKKGVKA